MGLNPCSSKDEIACSIVMAGFKLLAKIAIFSNAFFETSTLLIITFLESSISVIRPGPIVLFLLLVLESLLFELDFCFFLAIGFELREGFFGIIHSPSEFYLVQCFLRKYSSILFGEDMNRNLLFFGNTFPFRLFFWFISSMV